MSNLPEHEANQILEAHLESFGKNLNKGMSPLEAIDAVRELRAHLVASAAAYEEIGLLKTDAARAAIRALGDGQKLEAGLVHQSRRVARKPIDFFVTTLCGVTVYPLAMLPLYYGFHFLIADHLGLFMLERDLLILCPFGFLVGLSLFFRPCSARHAGLRSSALFLILFANILCFYARNLFIVVRPLSLVSEVVNIASAFLAGAALELARSWLRQRVQPQPNPPTTS